MFFAEIMFMFFVLFLDLLVEINKPDKPTIMRMDKKINMHVFRWLNERLLKAMSISVFIIIKMYKGINAHKNNEQFKK